MNNRKLIDKIIANWPAKMLSIALALILFVFHQMSITETRVLSVPLIVETTSALVPVGSYSQNVRVQLRGEYDSIRTIADSDIEAFADFSRFDTEGLYRVPVQIRRKGNALDVEPLEISVTPMEVFIQLDVRSVQTIPLRADIHGNVAAGFELLSYAIIPAEIVVSGPLNIMHNVTEIMTDTIDLGGRSGDFTLMVSIINPNPFLVLQGSQMAEFHGLVRPSIPEEQTDIPVIIIEPPDIFEPENAISTEELTEELYEEIF